MKNNINFLTEEIRINIPVKKDYAVMILLYIVPVSVIIGLLAALITVFGDIKPAYYLLVTFIIGSFVYSPITSGTFWKFSGKRNIIFDKKYIIVENVMGIKTFSQIFKIKDIHKISIDVNYRLTFWTRIKAFLSKDTGGCICIYGKNGMLTRIGYGLSIEESENLLSQIKEKQIFDNIKTV